MKYENMSLLEFFYYCNNSYISESEMYLYLKQITSNFDLTAFELLRKELNLYCCNIKFRIPEVIGSELIDGKPYVLNSYKHEITLYDFYIDKIQQPLIEHIEKKENATKEQKEVLFINLQKLKNDFVDKLDVKGKIKKIESYVPELNLNLLEKNKGIVKFSDLINEKYKGINVITPKPKSKNTKLSKQPLTFYQLFKNPFNKDLELFKKKLIDSNLIDNNYHWRTVDNNGKKIPIQDIGKFYNWLYSETTVFDKTPDKTAHCICFCTKFGIIPYEGKKNKPTIGRTATAKLIRETTFDSELELKYKTHFKTWINKEK